MTHRSRASYLSPPTISPAPALWYHRAVADRRFPLTVTDDEGVSRQGEVYIVRAWRSDVAVSPNASFTIVLAQEPLAGDCPPPDAPNVVVCAPACPVRLTAAVAEATVAYDANEVPSAVPLRFPRRALDAYAGGTLVASHVLPVTAREVFADGVPGARLDSLACHLLAATRRVGRCWEALDRILSWPDPPSPLAQPRRVRARLHEALRGAPLPPTNAPAADALQRLLLITGGAQPEGVAPSPAALAEDAAYLRCRLERPEAADELATMRAYVESARPGTSSVDVAADHAFTREQLSFVTLLEQPHQLDGLRATFEMFRAEYTRAYARHHRAYWQAVARLHVALEDARPAARALAALNTLRALGRPLGQEALIAYERLAEARGACDAPALDAALPDLPTCPSCGITMDHAAPTGAAEGVVRRLSAALARQQARLASEAIRRILARGGERLEQFLQIVQAADVAGLARVLDDDLLTFLGALLAQPVSPTPEAQELFEELARAHPVVSKEQVEAVAKTLRRLLSEQLESQGTADPSRPAAFRLASEPPPS